MLIIVASVIAAIVLCKFLFHAVTTTLLKATLVIGLIQALLEVTVLLEATLLCHLLQIVLALHLDTLSTCLVVLTAEKLVLAQLALQ